MFARAIGSMTLAEINAALDEFELTFGVIEGLPDVVTDAHLIENGVVIETESDDPNFAWTIANPIKIHGERQKKAIDPPAFGEHTLEILNAHGFSDSEIETLLREKTVFAQGS